MLLPLACLAFVALLAGCTTRSISNSGYQEGWRSSPSMYQGELNELDVLGTSPAGEASDAAIAAALDAQKSLKLRRGDKVLLIQSGAMMPDSVMLDAAGKYLDCAPFSGVPPKDKESLAASLRLRAAQGGFPYLVCYWGVIESGRAQHGGAALAWTPFVGGLVPDSVEKMRISLKAIVLDVRTGSWKSVTYQSEPLSRQSYRYGRADIDQKMVEELKQQGYERLLRACVE